MIAAHETGAGLALTATLLLTVAVLLCHLRLGRLVTKGTTMMAALGLLGALGLLSAVHAQAPEECRRECALDLEACRNSCIDSRDFDGCLEDCHDDEEDCLAGCRSGV